MGFGFPTFNSLKVISKSNPQSAIFKNKYGSGGIRTREYTVDAHRIFSPALYQAEPHSHSKIIYTKNAIYYIVHCGNVHMTGGISVPRITSVTLSLFLLTLI